MAHNKTYTIGRLTLEHVVTIASMVGGEQHTIEAVRESIKAIWGKYNYTHVVEVLELGMLHKHAERYKGTEALPVLNHLHDALVHLKRIEQLTDR